MEKEASTQARAFCALVEKGKIDDAMSKLGTLRSIVCDISKADKSGTPTSSWMFPKPRECKTKKGSLARTLTHVLFDVGRCLVHPTGVELRNASYKYLRVLPIF